MPDDALSSLLAKPDDLSESTAFDWFRRIAERLMQRTWLVAGGTKHRLAEIEFYYHGAEHADVFAHCDALQLQCGPWYFHRSHGSYRAGSFKGVDLSFGDGTAHGGILVRGLETKDGTFVDGPSLCVDHLLALTGHAKVADLDAATGGRPAWDADNPVRLEDAPELEEDPLATARVGLTLKRSPPDSPEPPRFLMRPYRFLGRPRRTKKGKPHMVLALHVAGYGIDEIKETTGCPAASIRRHIENHASGCDESNFAPYFGNDWNTATWCRLHGLWHREFAQPEP